MTDRYAVIGNPIEQSKSPQIHAQFARMCGQQIDYVRILGDAASFAATVRQFRDHGGRGLNVTAPFKLQAFELADEASEAARQAGAVNAMKFEGSRILGENFDGTGLVQDIQGNLGRSLAGRRVLVLGAGGAARGILAPILGERPAEAVIANRDEDKARALAQRFARRGPVRGTGYQALTGQPFDLVLNATSSSLAGELPPVPASAFGPDCLAYDLSYGRGLTPFLRLAREAGAPRLADGVGMLVEQAAEAFRWWRGVRPATRLVIESLAVPLA